MSNLIDIDSLLSETDSLTHHGVKGMKWGIRKSRVSGGRKGPGKTKDGHAKIVRGKGKRNVKQPRANTGRARVLRKQKGNSLKDMSDQDLKKSIERLRQEKEYRTLNESFLNKTLKKKGAKAFETAVENVASKAIDSAMKKAFGGGKDGEDAVDGAKKAVGKIVNKVGNKKKNRL